MDALPSTAALLIAWEQGAGASWAERGLALLRLAWPGRSQGALGGLTIADRNRTLLVLRRQLFGDELASVVTCPACGDSLEVGCSVAELTVWPGEAVPAATASLVSTPRCRLPTTDDLLAVQSLPAEQQPAALIRRCSTASADGNAPEVLSTERQAAIAAAWAEADPHADLQLPVECSQCRHGWRARLDIVAYLWAEVDRLARRTIAEVHLLARGYGWSEAEILGLTPWRRQLYLDLVRR